MARFTNKLLGVLDRLYNFNSEITSLSRFAITDEIQPVHDVSREAELGSIMGVKRWGGFFLANLQTAHAGATTERSSLQLYQDVLAHNGNWDLGGLSDPWIWVMDVWAGVLADGTESALTSLAIYVWDGVGTQRNAGPRQESNNYPQLIFNAASQKTPTTLNSAVTVSGMVAIDESPHTARYPRLIFDNEQLNHVQLVSVSSGIVTQVSGTLLLWIGPSGVLPPGMA